MNLHIFNAALLVGWLMVLGGSMLIHVGAGLVVGGLLLLILVFISVRLAGGVYSGKVEA